VLFRSRRDNSQQLDDVGCVMADLKAAGFQLLRIMYFCVKYGVDE